ncbi:MULTISPECIES: SDR family NAD(P)-dependent oxidoreductase [Thalassospira]|uniref:Short-chain dehydrogenase n=2 Tax=Thalassospira TaxID=168934 RepID=A0A367W9W7_9PROT|nr:MULTISPECIES: SDR family NAD(P)-dependent oxidoreductase [Thalassospira]MDG4720650.1 SDR family NAD(P)-dependent oxidoreductase [Thalassospira sp. FZY0004]RCK37381.1 short-chain dehydrogenase [Thalassospira profundimaris]
MTKQFTTIWIVGASAGIGAALAQKFHQTPTSSSQNIIVSARNTEKLNELATEMPGITPVAIDITDPNAVKAALNTIEKQFGLPDLVVLAAGIYSPMKVAHFSAETVRSHIDTNYMGIVNCLEPLLSRMRARKSGEIAVVASVAGYRGLPNAAAYGPTKAALINLCETLYAELRGSGVLLRVVNPGFVKTRLTDKNDFEMPYLLSPEQAAEFMYRDLRNNDKFEIAFPPPFVRQLKLARILPYGLFFKLMGKLVKA